MSVARLTVSRLAAGGLTRSTAVPRGHVAEPPFDHGAGLVVVDVAGDDEARVRWHVVLLEEFHDVCLSGGGQILHITNHWPVIRVVRRPQHLVELEGRHAVRAVLVALPPLVLDDVALAVDLFGRHRVEEKPHAIRIEEQRKVECVDRHVDVVVGPVVRRRGVVVRAGALEQCVELSFFHVLGAFEHEVLEQMREAGSPRLLVGRADVVPDVDRRDRHRLVLMQDDVEPVRELELPERHLKRRGRLRQHRRNQQDHGEQSKATAHADSLRGRCSCQVAPQEVPILLQGHLACTPFT